MDRNKKNKTNEKIKDLDLLGEAYKDFLKGKKGNYCFENPDGLINDDYKYYFGDKVRAFEKKLLRSAVEPVIDMGAGNGRILKYLKNKKIKAEGIEESKFMSEHGRIEGVLIHNKRITEFNDFKRFNSMIFFWTIGSLENPKNLEKYFQKISKQVEKGFRIIVADYALAKTDVLNEWFFEVNKNYGLEKNKIIYNRIEGNFRGWAFYNPKFLEILIEKEGFKVIERNYTNRSQVYGLVLKKR